MNDKLDKYNPDYTYKKEDVTIVMSSLGYPMVEQTNNGALFPLGPKDNLDMNEIK